MKTNCKNNLLFFLCLVSSFFIASCDSNNSQFDSEGRKIVYIGHAGPLTGPIAHLGKDNENGVKLAIQEANDKNISLDGETIVFKVVSVDDEGKESKTTLVAQKLVDSEVSGVIGHLNSGTTIPASKIYHDEGIPQISPSATNVNYTNQGFPGAFRVMANDKQQGSALANFAINDINASKIAVIDDRTAYGKGLADIFEDTVQSLGGIISTREFTDVTKSDFTAILTKIKGLNVDLIFYAGMDVQGGPMLKQLDNLGLNVNFLTGDGCQTLQFIELAGTSSQGVYASSPGVPLDKMPGGIAFNLKYEQTFNQSIQIYGPYAYDATNTLIDAMIKANSYLPEKYLPFLKKIQFKGVTGDISFDTKGDINRGSISMYQVKNSKWEYLKTLGDN
jgi:branched-chain amino acid transport system substrate-binding protein